MNHTALYDLTVILTEAGYCEYFSSFHPLSQPITEWIKHCDDAVETLRPMIDLFLLGGRIPKSSLDAEVTDCIEKIGMPIFVSEEDTVTLNNLVLIPIFGLWLFYERPQANMTLYFGEDSAALVTRQRPTAGNTCIDVCAGPGIQSLYAARLGETVTAVEINPIAAALARINAAMNRLDDKIHVVCDDLVSVMDNSSKKGIVYDRLTANPPLLPFPDDVDYPFVGHGGTDGLKLTWQILERLPDILSEHGFAQIIGTGLSDGFVPCFADRMEQAAKENNLRILCTVTSHQPLERGSHWFDGLVATAADMNILPAAEIADKLEICLHQQGATHLCGFYLFCQHTKKSNAGTFELQDVSDENGNGFWYII